MSNYIKIKNEYIDEISSNVTIYKHIKSGARICTIENDDNNKVFDITFRTPAINNGGLTHILEHSVLCGSKKYPVKDPFVELLKSSLNTFLNAFTYSINSLQISKVVVNEVTNLIVDSLSFILFQISKLYSLAI